MRNGKQEITQNRIYYVQTTLNVMYIQHVYQEHIAHEGKEHPTPNRCNRTVFVQ